MLFHYIPPQRFWTSQQRNRKVEVRAKMQRWWTTEGGARKNKQLQMFSAPRAALIFINKDFSRVWHIFSGLCRSLLYAKIMNNTEGQELSIYWLGTAEMGSIKTEIKVRWDCQITVETAFNGSTSHERFLCTSIWHSSIFLKDNQNVLIIGSLFCSNVSSFGFEVTQNSAPSRPKILLSSPPCLIPWSQTCRYKSTTTWAVCIPVFPCHIL